MARLRAQIESRLTLTRIVADACPGSPNPSNFRLEQRLAGSLRTEH